MIGRHIAVGDRLLFVEATTFKREMGQSLRAAPCKGLAFRCNTRLLSSTDDRRNTPEPMPSDKGVAFCGCSRLLSSTDDSHNTPAPMPCDGRVAFHRYSRMLSSIDDSRDTPEPVRRRPTPCGSCPSLVKGTTGTAIAEGLNPCGCGAETDDSPSRAVSRPPACRPLASHLCASSAAEEERREEEAG